MLRRYGSIFTVMLGLLALTECLALAGIAEPTYRIVTTLKTDRFFSGAIREGVGRRRSAHFP
jgi:hypothetical protein